MTSQRRRGFTLVELMIVVTIIAVLMAMAIPALRGAKIAAHEGSAVSSLRTITAANQTYKTRYGTFARVLTDLSDSGFTDSVLGSATVDPGKSGYVFLYSATRDTFQVNANPIIPGTTGNRFFFVDTSGVIRFNELAAAGPSDIPIDN